MSEILQRISQAVIEGNTDSTQTEVKAALDAGVSAGEILNDSLIPAMSEVGRLFEKGDYCVPEMLVAARAMKAGLEILKPRLIESDRESMGKVALGTVKGDLHDMGKNLVAIMLEGAGFEIVDLGIDVAPEKFVEAVRSGVNMIGISALLTTTMPNMEAVIRAVEAAGLRGNVKIIVGGAPVTAEFARRIGADGFAPDASQAVTLAKALLAS